jgi:ATP-dependent Clp protease ATP-binding subunit ClpA
MRLLFLLLILIFCQFSMNAQNLSLSRSPQASWLPWSEEPISSNDKKKDTKNPFSKERMDDLASILKNRVFGQDKAIKKVVATLMQSSQGLQNQKTPRGAFLFVGPSGVGKTYLAEQLSEALLGSSGTFFRLNASDYLLTFDKDRLFGASGTKDVDGNEAGLITKVIEKSPNCIILIEDIDAGNAYTFKPMLEILDKGLYKDSRNKSIDCRGCIFIFTSSKGAQKIQNLHALGKADKEIITAITPELSKAISTDLLNRLEPVIFGGLRPNILPSLLNGMLSDYTKNLFASHQVTLTYDPSVIEYMLKEELDLSLGARPVQQYIKQTLINAVTEAFNEQYLKSGDKAVVFYDNEALVIHEESQEELFRWDLDQGNEKVIPPFNFEQLLEMEQRLNSRILGQPKAVKASVSALVRYSAGISLGKGPIAALLYVGPTGVGKTQLAKELSEELLGSSDKLIRLDMSEYGEYSGVSRLIGSPPGYVNHEEGGQLTEALKKNPYAIVLLDEIEKADPKVMKMFLQIFDEGRITDSQGTVIDCTHVVFIMTTNLGAQTILSMQEGGSDDQSIIDTIQPTLFKHLSPELYNRMEIVLFNALSEECIDQMVYNMLALVQKELKKEKNINVSFDVTILEYLKANGFDYQLGARPLKRLIQQKLVAPIAQAIVEKRSKPGLFLAKGSEIEVFYEPDELVIKQKNCEEIFRWNMGTPETRIPFNLERLLNLEEKLNAKVLGQPKAIHSTVSALIRYAAGVNQGHSPIATLLYVGPTGVGKTQLAKELAEELLGSPSKLIRLDMSDYSEPHSSARLIGSPPGYVNHEEGGQLTEALREHPYAIVLLDEIEKAHPNVMKTFLQVFDEARITDSKGDVIDCSNVIFIMTTNLGAKTILSMQENGSSYHEIIEEIQPEIVYYLSPELFNRMEPVLFNGLSQDLLDQLIINMLAHVQAQFKDTKEIEIEFELSVVEYLKKNGFNYLLGARPMKRLIQQKIVTPIAKGIVQGHLHQGDKISVSYENKRLVVAVLSNK